LPYINQMILENGIRPPKTGRVGYRVRHCPGLYLQVSHTGVMSWVVMLNVNGKQIHKTLGRLTDIPTVEAARRIAIPMKEAARAGHDPLTAAVPMPETLLSLREICALPTPVETGVYFLLLGQMVQYIGQSNRVFDRIRAHRRTQQIPFDRWFILPVPLADLDTVEAMYIRAFNPAFNRGQRRRPGHILQ
jgi:hypothetical protein